MLRVWLLWPVPGVMPEVSRAQATTRPAKARQAPAFVKSAMPARIAWSRIELAATVARPSLARFAQAASKPDRPLTALPGRQAEPVASEPALLPGLPSSNLSRTPSRWSASAWLLLRDGSGAGGAVPVSQLGGAQAGVRVAYALGAARRLALTARLSAPLHGQGREAAAGISWRPTRAPVTLIAEQRVSLDGGRGGPALFAIAGLNPTPIAAGFRVEAYGEAGAIKRDRVEPFADGAARLSRPVTGGPVHVDLGVGAWGGAQRGATRVDIGPSIGASVPVARHTLRLTLDWRERVAGGAKPTSGPALTLGTDF